MTRFDDGATFEVATGVGPARVHLRTPPATPPGLLLLGHGAGGGFAAPDLTAAAQAATGLGWAVALVEQPWLVAGRRIATPPPTLDVAWRAAASAVADRLAGEGGPAVVVHAGRSAGARVACRSGAGLGARAVLCLAFPLHPPGRPDRSRAGELAGAGVPVLVVQGRRDPFGSPEEVAAAVPAATVVPVDGDHSLGRARGAPAAVRDTVAGWLAALPATP